MALVAVTEQLTCPEDSDVGQSYTATYSSPNANAIRVSGLVTEVNVELSLYLTKHYAMKTYREVDV
jgi:hypothetical protein